MSKRIAKAETEMATTSSFAVASFSDDVMDGSRICSEAELTSWDQLLLTFLLLLMML